MGAESLTDDEIQRLLRMRKRVVRANKEFAHKNRSLHADFELEGEDGTKFAIYARQNLRNKEDFSCGLRVKLASGEHVTLCRCNGPSHVHPNPLEGEELEFVCHIHRATQRYIEAGRKPEHFATKTDGYENLTGAAARLIEDSNVEGLSLPNIQQDLFESTGNE